MDVFFHGKSYEKLEMVGLFHGKFYGWWTFGVPPWLRAFLCIPQKSPEMQRPHHFVHQAISYHRFHVIVPYCTIFFQCVFFTIIKQIPWNPIKPHEKPCLYLYPIDWLLSWWKPIFIPLNPIVIYIYVLNPIYISHWLFFNPQQFIQFLR